MKTAPVLVWTEWLHNVRRLRSSTVTQYQDTLMKFADWEGAPTDWTQVDAPCIEAFMGRPRRGGIVGSPATQDRERVAIAMFYKFMQMRGQVDVNPSVDVGVPEVRNRAPKAVDDAVWRRLWTSDLCDDDRLWLGLGAFAGLRRREIVSLSPAQTDWNRGMFLGMERKGGKEEAVEYEQMARIVADTLPHVLPDVDRWLSIVTGHAIMRKGERCLITMDAPTTAAQREAMGIEDADVPDPGCINKRLAVVLRAAGLPHNQFSPHALRHTCVTNLLRCGVPIEVVSDCVGHSDIDTTRRYVKSAGRLSEWRDRLHK